MNCRGLPSLSILWLKPPITERPCFCASFGLPTSMNWDITWGGTKDRLPVPAWPEALSAFGVDRPAIPRVSGSRRRQVDAHDAVFTVENPKERGLGRCCTPPEGLLRASEPSSNP